MYSQIHMKIHATKIVSDAVARLLAVLKYGFLVYAAVVIVPCIR